ncbi:MAG: response regulator [Acidimicrobiales bacterium]
MSPSVLLVDDSVEICASIEEMLRFKSAYAHGLLIERTHSVHGALGFLHESRFGVVVVDYRLSDGVGSEVVRKARDCCAETLVIGMSADDSRSVREDMTNAGVNHFFPKVNLAGLVTTVCVHCATHLDGETDGVPSTQ